MLIKCFQGVPPTLRSWVWMEVSGAATKKAAVGSNYFNNMALAGEKSEWLEDIDKVKSLCCYTAARYAGADE